MLEEPTKEVLFTMRCDSHVRLFGVASILLVLSASRASRADDAAGPVEPTPPNLTAPPDATVQTVPPSVPGSARPRFGASGSVVLDDVLGFGLTSRLVVVGSPFGAVGQSAMTGWVAYNNSSQEMDGRSQRFTTLAIAPTVDVFVAPRLSLGSQVAVFRSTVRAETESTGTGGALKPRIGYVFPIGDDLAFWARGFGAFSVAHVTNEGYAPPGASPLTKEQTTIGWGLGADGVLVASVGRHVALTFGPTLSWGKVDAFDDGPAAQSQTGVAFGVRGGISLVL